MNRTASSTVHRGQCPLLISIVGPTAVGKTGLAIRLAQHLNTEIVSADSRQFYRGIPIGTAQPTAAERAQAPHHFIDFLELDQPYSAGRFAADAVQWLAGFFEHRRSIGTSEVAILVGGSGLYTQAVQEGLDDMPSDPDIRAALNAVHAEEGLPPLLQELAERDPVHRRQVDPSNPHRVIRALEICRITGGPYSDLRKRQADRSVLHAGGWTSSKERDWDTLTLGLNAPRAVIHDRIDARTLGMVEAGWLEEARHVRHHRHTNALRTVGYPQLFEVLEHTMDMPTAIQKIQEATRQFARRQLTWFHRQQGVHWIDARYPERGVELVDQFMQHGFV